MKLQKIIYNYSCFSIFEEFMVNGEIIKKVFNDTSPLP